MQLFDDDRYKTIRKKYDPKSAIGFGIVLTAMLANFLIDSTIANIALNILKFMGFLYLLLTWMKLRREIKALELLRESE